MANHTQNEGWKRISRPACRVCEAMLTDAVDETLSEAERTCLDAHLLTCTSCTRALEEVQRGAAWLAMLKTPRPEPSAGLVERILANTERAGLEPVLPAQIPAQPQPAGHLLQFPGARWAGYRPSPLTRLLFEPRLAMTAAMAFFSIALTLNLTGVRLADLHASDLRPASLQLACEHGFYAARSSIVRGYDNLRVVHELESRVDELKSAGAVEPRASEPRSPRQTPGGPAQERSPGRPHPPEGRGVSQAQPVLIPAEKEGRV